MKILLLHIRTNSGNDVFFARLHKALTKYGVHTTLESIPSLGEYLPRVIRSRVSTAISKYSPDILVTHAEAAGGIGELDIPILAIAHHRPGDPNLLPFLTTIQRCYYKWHLDRIFSQGLQRSESVVCVSEYTAASVSPLLPNNKWRKLRVILNGIDTNYFTPATRPPFPEPSVRKLLFIGNPSKRKGFDLLSPILKGLGDGYQLRFTTGLRGKKKSAMRYPQRNLPGQTRSHRIT